MWDGSTRRGLTTYYLLLTTTYYLVLTTLGVQLVVGLLTTSTYYLLLTTLGSTRRDGWDG